jgi:4-amino-4-deoxy-L-arabinose transferase-like glycosyltransferase
MKNERLKYGLIFAALGALFFIPFLGGVHLFDWDEINFAEISREMLITREYTRIFVNFDPFWEKPPFFFWIQAGAMAVFGVGEFAARFPNAICGVLTLVLLFDLGRRLFHTRFGVIWAAAYMGSVLPFLYFKSGIIDPWFNFFIFLGLYFFILFYWKKDGFTSIELPRNKWTYLFLGGFFIGMGILTKGQVAFLIAALTMGVYWIYQRFRFYVSIPQFLFFTFSATLVTLTWYGLETMKNGSWFIEEFNKYQYRLFSTPDAGHRGFPGYHFVVLLAGCFPASVFAVRAFFRQPEEEKRHQQDFRIWMKFLFWTVLILFTIVKSKIVHYSSMCYFPLTFLAASVIDKMIDGKIEFKGWMKGLLWGLGALYITALIALPILAMIPEMIKPLLKDPFAQANLEAAVSWTGMEILPGLFLLGLLIAFFRYYRYGRKEFSFRLLFAGMAVFIMIGLVFFIKRIEGYSQRAAVEFFESKAGEDCYLTTYGYKSYVHLFYGRPLDGEKCCFQDSECTRRLIHDPVDKPVYIATKIHKAQELEKMETLEEIGRKNGFVFFKRITASQ